MADRIFRLTNGVSFGARYTVQSTDEAVSAVAEVVELTVGSEATATGVLEVTLPSLAPVDITVHHEATNEVISFTVETGCTTSGDLGIQLSTALGYVDVALLDTDDQPEEVAAKIAAAEASFTGWTVVADGALVTFTKTDAGVNAGAAGVQVGTTGVTLVAPGIVYNAIGYDADDTADLVAAEIGAGTFTGWTAAVVNNVITFTNDTEGAVSGLPAFDGTGGGVTASTIEVTAEGVDEADGNVTFIFKGVGDLPVAYPLSAKIQVVDSSNVNVDLADAVITYPANGTVSITSGDSTFTLTAGYKISIIAQRSAA